jgi:hypothetical protein
MVREKIIKCYPNYLIHDKTNDQYDKDKAKFKEDGKEVNDYIDKLKDASMFDGKTSFTINGNKVLKCEKVDRLDEYPDLNGEHANSIRKPNDNKVYTDESVDPPSSIIFGKKNNGLLNERDSGSGNVDTIPGNLYEKMKDKKKEYRGITVFLIILMLMIVFISGYYKYKSQ